MLTPCHAIISDAPGKSKHSLDPARARPLSSTDRMHISLAFHQHAKAALLH